MNKQEQLSVPALRRVVFAVAPAGLGMIGFWMASAALASPRPVSATVSATAQTDEERLEPGQVSQTKSRVYVFVDKTGFGHQHGIEGRLKSGVLKLGAGEEAGEIVFDMDSCEADTDEARRYVGLKGSTDSSTCQQVTANMKNSAILNVREFPTATFSITSAKLLQKKGPHEELLYELSGAFTLRDKTRPLAIVAEVEQKDGMAHVRGRFSLLQTEYGITPYRKALGAIGVADRLTIMGDLWVATEDAASNR